MNQYGFGELEIYDTNRFFTITGELYEGCPPDINEAQLVLDEIYEELFGDHDSSEDTEIDKEVEPSASDEVIIQKILKSNQGEKFRKLFYTGYKEEDEYDSNSEADQALCTILAIHTDCNFKQMLSLFKQSALYDREKHKRRDDEPERDIKNAIKYVKSKNKPIEERHPDLYFHGKNIVECGVTDEGFFMTKLNDRAFYIMVGASNREEKDRVYAHMVENRRIKHLNRVDYYGVPDISENQYEIDLDKGNVEVKIAAIQTDKKDNGFIEQYLQQTFGGYTSFIKKYMAMFTYTNFQRLPTLILYGPRGSSKSTFAEMMGSIYPPLYTDWNGSIGSYTPEAEKKLLVVDENASCDKDQYQSFKKYSGVDYLVVNKKYQPEYKVRNNLNIILTSNEPIPMYVEKSEMPTSPANNQFFV